MDVYNQSEIKFDLIDLLNRLSTEPLEKSATIYQMLTVK